MARSFSLIIVLTLLFASCGPDDEPTTPTEPEIGQAGDRPVILVPGVAGSQLIDGDQEYWAAVSDQVLSLSDDFLLELALAEDGTPGGSSVTHGDIVRRASIELAGFGVKEADFYGTIIERFESAGYAEDEMLFIFPYDWRIDINVEAERLRAFIDEVLDDSESDQVDIVAHSMGGLVTLDALQDPGMDGKVARLVTLGTPVLGATKALGVLEYKSICFTEEILDRHCITNPSTAQQVMTNFATAYQLLPSRAFEHAVGSPLEIAGTDTSYDEWTGIVRNNRNAALFETASNWQSQIDLRPHDPEVEMLRVIGSDRATPTQIERFTIHDCFFFTADFCPEKTVTKVVAGPGDGTVPRASASLHAPDRGFDERGGVQNHYVDGVSHMGLTQDSGVLSVVLDFLTGETEARVASIASSGLAAQTIAEEPEAFEGMAVTMIGPAWGPVASEQDEVTGPVAEEQPDVVYEEIPGSGFWRSPNAQVFTFSDPGSYFARFTVPPEGSAERRYLAGQAAPDELVSEVILIEIERYREADIEDTAIFRIEPTEGMSIEFSFDTGGDPDDVEIFIDRDGDGQYDEQAVEVSDRGPLPAVPTATPTISSSPTSTSTATLTPTATPSLTPTPTPEVVARQLLQVGPNNELLPDLITSWEISEGGDLLAIEVDQDVTLASGSPLVSEALVEIIEANREDFIQYEYIGSRVIDDYTFTIVLGTTAAEEFLFEIANIEVEVLERVN